MTNFRVTYQMVVVSIVLAVTLSALPVAATAPSDASGPEFVSSYVTDQRGDVARFAVRMSGSDSADVRIFSGRHDYETELTIRDDDNDGIVTVEFNTYLAGEESAFRTASDGDAVKVWTQTDVDGPLATGEYQLRVDDGEKKSRLNIERRSTDGIVSMVAPEDASDRLRTTAAIERARDAGNLTARRGEEPAAVARHDTLALRLDASGLSGPLAAQPGSNVTERFRALVASDVLSFDVVQTEATVLTSQRRAHLALNESGVRVVSDVRRNRYYLVVDTAAVHYRRGEDGAVETGLPVGTGFEVDLAVEADGELGVDEPRAAGTTFEIVERSATLGSRSESGGNYLSPAPGQAVEGETTVAPGTTVDLRIEQPDGDFGTTRTVTVERTEGRGTLAASVDLSGLDEGDALEATASDHSGSLSTDPAHVTVRSPAAALTEPRLEVENHQLYAAVEANLSRGGLISVRVDNASGRLLGAAPAEPGSSTIRIPIEDLPEKDTPLILTAVRDMDGDGVVSPSVDVPYEQSDSSRPVTSTVTLYRLPPSPTPTPSPTEGGATTTPSDTPPDPTGSPVDTTEPPTRTSTTGGDQLPVDVPGFGAGAALVALGAALLLIGRRE